MCVKFIVRSFSTVCLPMLFSFYGVSCGTSGDESDCQIQDKYYLTATPIGSQQTCLPSHVLSNYRVRFNPDTGNWTEIRRNDGGVTSVIVDFNPKEGCKISPVVSFRQSLGSKGARDVTLKYEAIVGKDGITGLIAVQAPCTEQGMCDMVGDCKFSANLSTTIDPCHDGLSDDDFVLLSTNCDGQDEDKCKNGYLKCVENSVLKCIEDPDKQDIQEWCNGEDDDCDGQTDEDLGEETCGQGQCVHTIDLCKNGEEQTCDPLEGQDAEICNGKDDNCDGQVDENFPDLGKPCDGPDADKCENSVWTCNMDHSGIECIGDENITEICDELDNDCDDKTDEDFNLSTDPAHCGACNEPCPQPGNDGVGDHVLSVACQNKKCAVGSCGEGFSNPDGLLETGCEQGCAASSTFVLSNVKSEMAPVLSPRTDGGFLAVWAESSSSGPDSSGLGSLKAQLIDAKGLPVGGAQTIEGANVPSDTYHRIDVEPDGDGWLVTYRHLTSTNPIYAVLRVARLDSEGKPDVWSSDPMDIDGEEYFGYSARVGTDVVVVWNSWNPEIDSVRFCAFAEDGSLATEPKKITLSGGTYPVVGFVTVSSKPDQVLLIYWTSDNKNILALTVDALTGDATNEPVELDSFYQSDDDYFLVSKHIDNNQIGVFFKYGSSMYLSRIDYAGSIIANPVDVLVAGNDQLKRYAVTSMLQQTTNSKGWAIVHWANNGSEAQSFSWWTTEGEEAPSEEPLKLTDPRPGYPSLSFDGNVFGIAWADWNDGMKPKLTTLSCIP